MVNAAYNNADSASMYSQYTSTVRVKVSDPATLLPVIWYTPLSLRVTSAIVKLVAVTVNLVSLTSVPLNVMLSMVEGGLASREKETMSCPPSVGVAVTVVREN